eukprot:m.1031047 g.1031047  ORF g.1031047 m.1031047 type:complete len:578 (-) comp24120_c0_seq5:2814-4547(-)
MADSESLPEVAKKNPSIQPKATARRSRQRAPRQGAQPYRPPRRGAPTTKEVTDSHTAQESATRTSEVDSHSLQLDAQKRVSVAPDHKRTSKSHALNKETFQKHSIKQPRVGHKDDQRLQSRGIIRLKGPQSDVPRDARGGQNIPAPAKLCDKPQPEISSGHAGGILYVPKVPPTTGTATRLRKKRRDTKPRAFDKDYDRRLPEPTPRQARRAAVITVDRDIERLAREFSHNLKGSTGRETRQHQSRQPQREQLVRFLQHMAVGQRLHEQYLTATLSYPTDAPKHKWMQRAWREYTYTGIKVFRQGLSDDKSREAADPTMLKACKEAYTEFLNAQVKAYENFLTHLSTQLESTRTRPERESDAGALETHRAAVPLQRYWAGTTVFKDVARKVKAGTLALHEAYTCVGDLRRYAVLHGKHKGKDAWASCVASYTSAMRLCPKNGQLYNKLAIVSTHTEQPIDTVYYYTRSLCVRQPILTARDGLTAFFALHRQKQIDKADLLSSNCKHPTGGTVACGNRLCSRVKQNFVINGIHLCLEYRVVVNEFPRYTTRSVTSIPGTFHWLPLSQPSLLNSFGLQA